VTRRMTRRPTGTSTLAGLFGAVVVAVLLAACGGSTATPGLVEATPAPTTAAVATPAPTAAPTAEPTAKPTPEPYEFASTAYDYRATLPGVSEARQALRAWDGQARIDSTGPYTDTVSLPGSILFFVYGAPTDLALDDYAARTQEQMVSWHECPVTPDSATDLTLDGTAGRLHRMTCLGAYVQKLMVVRDGQGLVVNMIAPPGTEDKASKLFEDLVAGMTWPA
jgi:hypothetical protein